MTRIIIADDHQMIVEGLASLLNDVPEIDIVGSAANGEEVLKIIKNNVADLILMDINMPKLNGIDTTLEIKKNYKEIKILIVSMHNKEGFVKNAIEAGADGYILKNTGKAELLLAIDYIMNGKTYYAQDVTQTLVTKMRTNGDLEGFSLSTKEKQILQLLANGKTSQEIAVEIVSSEHTINTYRKNLLVKFDAKNVPELIKKSIWEGYIL